ncbi:MAG: alpha/beta hydrolase [Bacteroidota bacterium]|nr:alpha/beta hydrolase [Bacteroidota bacterium]
MKKPFKVILGLLFLIIIAFAVFVILASKPVPTGTDEIIAKVFSTGVPEQIYGDTGYVSSGEVSIWYESIQPKSKPKGTILLIMGLGGNAMEWPLYFTEPLVEAGYHVIRFDNRGTGLSTWPDKDFSILEMKEDAIAVLDALDVKEAHVLGMSMGGMIGQLMAFEHPERVQSLISFMSSGYTDDPDLPSISRLSYLSLIATGIRHGIPLSEKNTIRTTVSVRSVMTPTLSEKRIMSLAEQSLYNLRFRKGFNPRAFIQHTKAVRNSGSRYAGLKNINIPVLVIHGKQDPLIPVEHAMKMAKIIPNSKILLLDGMGHDVSPEHTPIIHKAVLEFLDLKK